MSRPCVVLITLLVACSGARSSTPSSTAPAASAASLSVPPIASSAPVAATPPPRPAPPVKKLAASPGHTCALLVSGEIACWGGGIGPVEHGYRTNIKRPRIVAGIRDAIDVATGLYHTCAARSDGKVLCWGWDSDGELGGGERPEIDDTPILVPKLDDVVELASRASHTCARRRDGHVLCWGKNDQGQLGRAPVLDKWGGVHVQGVVEVPGIADAVELVTSHSRSCARRASGRVVCWGEPMPDVPPAPRGGLQAFPEVSDAVGLAADSATCAIRANGDALCFGGMSSSSITFRPGVRPTFRRELAVHEVTSLALGGSAECAVTRSGGVECWGEGVSGELGDGSTLPHASPKAVVGLTDALQVVASWNHMCALRKNHQVVCWGSNNDGQLGIGTDDVERTPFLVPGVTASKIAVGSNQSCAIVDGQKLLCWGHDVTATRYYAQEAIRPIAGLGAITDVALGRGHGCAVTTTGSVVCWGNPSSLGAQLPYRDERAVHSIAGVSDAVSISTGDDHSCARKKDGTVACWGQNREGQLGDGTTRPSLAAVAVSGLVDAVDVRCGGGHTCALRKNGDVACWGQNRGGQAGAYDPNGEPSASPPSPVTLTFVRGASAIGAGGDDSCAIISGKVTCWGQWHHGRVTCRHPGGCPGPRYIDVPGVTDAVAISVGQRKQCILRTNANAATCWPRIDDNQNDLKDVPLGVAASAIAVAGEHSCALSGGSVRCWGRNSGGEVGAPLPYRTAPVAIGW